MVYIPNEDVSPTSVSSIRNKLEAGGESELDTSPREPTVFDYAQSNQF